jgi:Zn-dependent protease with chaperone function
MRLAFTCVMLLVTCALLSFSSPALADVAPEPPAPREPASSGYHLSPEKRERAIEYARAGYRLYFASTLYGLVALLLVLRGRVVARYRSWAERASKWRFVQLLIIIPLFAITMGALGLPFDAYGHWLARKYDQSIQSWGSWFLDLLKGGGIVIVLGTLVAWVLYFVIRRSPRRWWLYFWLSAIPIVIFLQFIAPVVIEPLFFKFKPLTDQHADLANNLERVVNRGGLDIPIDRMFEMEASEKLKALNAYVAGIGASKRVVVWDTTIAKMTAPEIMFVFGHEMGHYVLGHIAKGIAFALALLLLFLYIGYRGAKGIIERFGAKLDIRDMADFSSLPLLMLLISGLSFLATPIEAGFSRHLEHQADIYGLNAIQPLVSDYRHVAANAFQVLGEVDLSDPEPSRVIEFWLYDHPSIPKRIDFVLNYDASEEPHKH